MRQVTLNRMISYAGLLAIMQTLSPLALVSECRAAVIDPTRPLGVLIFSNESHTASPGIRLVPHAVSPTSPTTLPTPESQGQTADKPLGTLWYQAPYNANRASRTAMPILTPAAPPPESRARPLGTLRQPHRYVSDDTSPGLRSTPRSPAPANSAPISENPSERAGSPC